MNIEDSAQAHEVKMWEMANAVRPAAAVYAPGEPGYGPAECAQCGDDMPALRRRDGRRLCTTCQSALEVRRR